MAPSADSSASFGGSSLSPDQMRMMQEQMNPSSGGSSDSSNASTAEMQMRMKMQMRRGMGGAALDETLGLVPDDIMGGMNGKIEEKSVPRYDFDIQVAWSPAKLAEANAKKEAELEAAEKLAAEARKKADDDAAGKAAMEKAGRKVQDKEPAAPPAAK